MPTMLNSFDFEHKFTWGFHEFICISKSILVNLIRVICFLSVHVIKKSTIWTIVCNVIVFPCSVKFMSLILYPIAETRVKI